MNVLDAADQAKADVGDLAHWKDVDFDRQTVRVRGTKTNHAAAVIVLPTRL